MIKFEEEIRYIFKKYKLGCVCTIVKIGTWANGDKYIVTTWLKKYIVTEENNHVRTIKTKDKIFYVRGETD